MKHMKKVLIVFLVALLAFQVSAVSAFAAAPKNTTTTSTKTSSKTEKLSKKSKKTYEKTTTATKKNSKISTTNGYKKTVVTTVKTVTKKNYTKGSKNVKVKVKVTTTVKTTYTKVTTSSNSSNSSSASKPKDYYRDLTAAEKSKIGAKVSNAFSTLGFRILVEGTQKGYAGCADINKKTIHLYYEHNSNTTIYHELGHFVSFLAGNASEKDDFAAIYKAEKGKYTKFNKSYVTTSPAEFFAECYKLYVTDPSYLKTNLPKTYSYVQKSLNNITDSRIALYKKVLG